MRAHIQPVKDELSHDTIECLEHLLKEAKEGKVIGLAFAALRPRHDGFAHVCGPVDKKKDRRFIHSLVLELDEELRAWMRH